MGYTYTAGCSFNNRFSVSPNPANTELNVSINATSLLKTSSFSTTEEIPTPESIQFEISIYNDKGKKITQQKNEAGVNDITIDTQNIPNGTYFIHINDGAEIIKKQIIIQH
ncbi:MAG: T9SS C-terminal target domain-containing protein [Sphingobacteriales bacterium]|nr:MAG: T9SS C-terminal target domain-containing protein [Sphingobacteriales bacterium]